MSLFLCSLAANLKKVFARYYLVVLLATVDTVALTDARSNPLVAIWQRNPKDRIRTRDWTTTIERSIYSYSIMIMTLAFSLSRLHVDIPATSCLYTSLSSRFRSERHGFRPLAYSCCRCRCLHQLSWPSSFFFLSFSFSSSTDPMLMDQMSQSNSCGFLSHFVYWTANCLYVNMVTLPLKDMEKKCRLQLFLPDK